jgi:predicted signal transduction protein with EAL and GGDEF domain
MRALQELGCDDMQGFYFSKPLPAGEVESLLLESTKRPIIHHVTQQTLHYFGDAAT